MYRQVQRWFDRRWQQKIRPMRASYKKPLKYLPSKTLLIALAVGVVLAGGAFIVWTSQKPAASFERETRSGGDLPKPFGQSSDNITARTAQGLLSEYLTAQEGRDSLTEEERQRIAEDVAEQVRQKNAWEPPYVLGDLPLTEDSPAVYRAYGNALGTIFARYEKNALESEIVVMKRAFASRDRTELAKILVNADAYRSIAEDLSRVSVPRSLADIHIRFLNGYAGIAYSLTETEVVFEDSLRGMTGIKLYSDQLDAIVLATIDLRSFFSSHQITFSEAEPGFPLAAVRP